jgi:hypothetical protein
MKRVAARAAMADRDMPFLRMSRVRMPCDPLDQPQAFDRENGDE